MSLAIILVYNLVFYYCSGHAVLVGLQRSSMKGVPLLGEEVYILLIPGEYIPDYWGISWAIYTSGMKGWS